MFTPIDWNEYNRPPYLPQWLATGETLKRANYDDPLLADIEGAIHSVSGQYDLDLVKGMLLDRIGKIVVEGRNGNEDELYRVLLKLKIMLNAADGTINNVIKIIKFFYSSEVVHIAPDYPAGITILHDGEGPNLDFNRIVAALVPAGVSYNTKEIFYFSYEFPFADEQRIITKKQDLEVFPTGLRHNGQVLRNHGQRNVRNGTIDRIGTINRKGYRPIDGTVYDTVQIRSQRKGTLCRDGKITRTGTFSNPATDSISIPITHSSGQKDRLSSELVLDAFSDNYQGLIKHNGTILRDGSNFDAFHDLPMLLVIRKQRQRNGTIMRKWKKRDGSICRDGSLIHFTGSRHSGDIILET